MHRPIQLLAASRVDWDTSVAKMTVCAHIFTIACIMIAACSNHVIIPMTQSVYSHSYNIIAACKLYKFKPTAH